MNSENSPLTGREEESRIERPLTGREEESRIERKIGRKIGGERKSERPEGRGARRG